MALIIILIALVVQRFLKFNSIAYQIDWAPSYFHWMSSKVKLMTTCHSLWGLVILIVPIVILAAVIFGLTHALLGWFGAGVLQLVLVWYCLDIKDIYKAQDENTTTEAILLRAYQGVFVLLFWYGLFGPVGLVLYVTVNQLLPAMPKTLVSSTEQASRDRLGLYDMFVKVQALLDWVPVRLLGLSFALVGSFAVVFKLWLQKLFDGIINPQALVVEWGQAALKAESIEGVKPAIDLVDRSLLVWLAVLFLVTLGVFLG